MPWYAWVLGPPEALLGFLVTWPPFWRWVGRRAEQTLSLPEPDVLPGPVRLITDLQGQFDQVTREVQRKLGIANDPGVRSLEET